MLEIEMKFAVADFAEVVGVLESWQARPEPVREEADHYFNAPDRDFRRTDEAFRLRRVGADNWLTYKGPKQTGPAKTRDEIEVPLQAGDAVAEKCCRILARLGYRPTAVVRKRRTIWHCRRNEFAMQVCCDEVLELGRFVEIEIVAPPADKSRAEAALQQAAAALGLRDAIRASYLEMHLARQPSETLGLGERE
ncbi:MAG: class IV adenylate cyclase [Gemmataceae bacterium]|nr:class IV adenylate cyclase [Gemmataceae bacterium]